MERHKCKVCLKRFPNGRALGGHMRSHMVNLLPAHGHDLIMSEDHHHHRGDSAPSSSDGDDDDEEKSLSYGLRENPKRSIRMVDREFSFAGSVVVQDRESETESSKNPRGRRSNRRMMRGRRKTIVNNVYNKKEKEKESEAEAVSSISTGSTTEEDVAFWLMMLSRDKWTTAITTGRVEEESEEEEESDDDDDDSGEEGLKLNKNGNSRGNYECETCKKVFGSYQALGGHRASHKKMKAIHQANTAAAAAAAPRRAIHECPVCLRVFASGQALGGHKRSHLAAFSSTPPAHNNNFRRNFIDLNLPPPFHPHDLQLSAITH